MIAFALSAIAPPLRVTTVRHSLKLLSSLKWYFRGASSPIGNKQDKNYWWMEKWSNDQKDATSNRLPLQTKPSATPLCNSPSVSHFPMSDTSFQVLFSFRLSSHHRHCLCNIFLLPMFERLAIKFSPDCGLQRPKLFDFFSVCFAVVLHFSTIPQLPFVPRCKSRNPTRFDKGQNVSTPHQRSTVSQ